LRINGLGFFSVNGLGLNLWKFEEKKYRLDFGKMSSSEKQ
jgi:hypothetical protein